MTWKYILFDLDGTITDSGEGILNCVRYALEAAGRPVRHRSRWLISRGMELAILSVKKCDRNITI